MLVADGVEARTVLTAPHRNVRQRYVGRNGDRRGGHMPQPKALLLIVLKLHDATARIFDRDRKIVAAAPHSALLSERSGRSRHLRCLAD